MKETEKIEKKINIIAMKRTDSSKNRCDWMNEWGNNFSNKFENYAEV